MICNTYTKIKEWKKFTIHIFIITFNTNHSMKIFTNSITSPVAPQPKQVKICLSSETTKEGVFSLWKGQSPTRPLPLLRRFTYLVTVDSISQRYFNSWKRGMDYSKIQIFRHLARLVFTRLLCKAVQMLKCSLRRWYWQQTFTASRRTACKPRGDHHSRIQSQFSRQKTAFIQSIRRSRSFKV